MKTKRIFLIGDIDSELYENFTKELREFERTNVDKVIVELTSEGGDPYSSLAFYSRIRESSCNIHIVARGYVASAAVLVLAAGDYRAMSKETWVMVHEETEEISLEVHKAEAAVLQMRNMENQADRLLAARSDLTAEEWKRYHRDTTYFTADECLGIGLIDEVLYEKEDE